MRFVGDLGGREIVVFLEGGASAEQAAAIGEVLRAETMLREVRPYDQESVMRRTSEFYNDPEISAILTVDAMPRGWLATVVPGARRAQVKRCLAVLAAMPGAQMACLRREL